jgi:hypothetical protein
MAENELPFSKVVDQPLPIRFASSAGGGVNQPLRELVGYC